MTEEKWVEGVEAGRNGGDDEDNRWGLDEGEKRAMTSGRGARRRLRGGCHIQREEN